MKHFLNDSRKILGVIAIAFLLVIIIPRVSVQVPTAKAANSHVPILDMQFADYNTGNCNDAGTWGPTLSTPAGGGLSQSAGDSNNFEPNCVRIMIDPSTPPPYDHDFQIGFRLEASHGGSHCDEGSGGEAPGPWVITNSATGQFPGTQNNALTPWESDSLRYDIDCGQIQVVDKGPLTGGQLLNNVAITAQVGDGNSGGPYNCQQPPYSPDQVVTASVGAWSSWSLDPGNIDCMQMSLSGNALDAAENGPTNLPTTAAPNQVITVGTDGQQLFIPIKNKGTVAWPANDWVATNPSGTCHVDSDSDGILDAPNPSTDPVNSQCVVNYSYTTSAYNLDHTSGSFGANPPKATYKKNITVTRVLIHEQIQICSDGSLQQDLYNKLAFAGHFLAAGTGDGGPPQCHYTYQNIVETHNSGNPNVAPGETVDFVLDSLTAPATPGTYTETWQMGEGDPIYFGTPWSTSIAVAPIGPAINVTSQNSVTNNLVSSTWQFNGSPSDPCNGHQDQCMGMSKTYTSGILAGSSTDLYYFNADTTQYPAGHGYAFAGVYQELAAVKVQQNPIISFFTSLIQHALAITTCGFLNSDPQQCLSGQSSYALVLAGNRDIANFTAKWDPIAAMQVNPTSLNLIADNNGNASGSFTIINNGTDGSSLVWGESHNTWLTLSSSSGTLAVGAQDTVRVNAFCDGNPTTGHIILTGSSNPGNRRAGGTNPLTIPVNVTGCAALPNLNLSANPAAVIPPATTTLTYGATNVDTSTCTLSGTNGFHQPPPPLHGGGTNLGGTTTDAPTANTIYTLACQGLESDPYYNASTSVSVVVNKPGTVECNPGEGQNCQ